MSIKQIVYNNSDVQYEKVINFLTELKEKNNNLIWDDGRMIFWRHAIHGNKAKDDVFFKNNARVWMDDEKIIGICISEYGKNDIFISLNPEYIDIYKEMILWAEKTWAAGKENIEMDVFEENAEEIKRLLDNGYEFKCHFENLRTYDLNKANLNYKLKDGFYIQAFYENKNFDNRVEVVKSAFDNDTYSKDNLNSIHSSEDYIKELDLCVVSPEGKIAAYCIGWRDKNSENSGYIEPVGTHKDFRRNGFASAMIKECFSRMKDMGMLTVEIASRAEPNISNFLYDSLKPVAKRKILKYSKDK